MRQKKLYLVVHSGFGIHLIRADNDQQMLNILAELTQGILPHNLQIIWIPEEQGHAEWRYFDPQTAEENIHKLPKMPLIDWGLQRGLKYPYRAA